MYDEVSSTMRGSKDRKNDAKRSNENPAFGGARNVKCERNAAYNGVAAKSKVSADTRGSGTNKNKANGLSLSDVKCKKNESYGGVAVGYKVIREVALSHQEKSQSSSVLASPNQAYKL